MNTHDESDTGQVAALQRQLVTATELVQRLSARVDGLEKEIALLKKRSDVEIPSDVLIAISAAVSAYLGNKGRVKAVHFSRHATWAVQGRQNVQARRL